MTGNNVSLISADGEGGSADNSILMSENAWMKEQLKHVMMNKRQMRAEVKYTRKRHQKLCLEDLNNAFAVWEFVRRTVFPHIKMRNQDGISLAVIRKALVSNAST